MFEILRDLVLRGQLTLSLKLFFFCLSVYPILEHLSKIVMPPDILIVYPMSSYDFSSCISLHAVVTSVKISTRTPAIPGDVNVSKRPPGVPRLNSHVGQKKLGRKPLEAVERAAYQPNAACSVLAPLQSPSPSRPAPVGAGGVNTASRPTGR